MFAQDSLIGRSFHAIFYNNVLKSQFWVYNSLEWEGFYLTKLIFFGAIDNQILHVILLPKKKNS